MSWMEVQALRNVLLILLLTLSFALGLCWPIPRGSTPAKGRRLVMVAFILGLMIVVASEVVLFMTQPKEMDHSSITAPRELAFGMVRLSGGLYDLVDITIRSLLLLPLLMALYLLGSRIRDLARPRGGESNQAASGELAHLSEPHLRAITIGRLAFLYACAAGAFAAFGMSYHRVISSGMLLIVALTIIGTLYPFVGRSDWRGSIPGLGAFLVLVWILTDYIWPGSNTYFRLEGVLRGVRYWQAIDVAGIVVGGLAIVGVVLCAAPKGGRQRDLGIWVCALALFGLVLLATTVAVMSTLPRVTEG